MITPLVRAVVVNWNGEDLLPTCLDSLVRQDLPPGALEVVVVDNDSHDGSVDLVRRDFPDARLVQNSTNRGFAGGVNSGLEDLEAPYVVLLNNDARFDRDAVRRMIDVLEAPGNEDVGAVTALLLLEDTAPDGTRLVNSTGNVVSRSGSATDRDWLTPLERLDARPEVFGFCGGAVVLRTTALEQVGHFDDSLFLYYEDTDLSWRLRAGRWRILFEREAVAWHRHAQSSDSTSALFRYYNNRNALLVFARYAPLPVVVKAFARQALAPVVHALRRDERPELLRARVRALVDAVRRARGERLRARPARRGLEAQGGLGAPFGD
ncbi:glycosyltransferase family 2 protein [Oerskovia sp. NPDC056781]|uniref:glycosyltransferase family 2 protein n=1 Tax=Oerskovia sp. NPDC056781 TaxID=3345942 RepID=UPI00366C6D41